LDVIGLLVAFLEFGSNGHKKVLSKLLLKNDFFCKTRQFSGKQVHLGLDSISAIIENNDNGIRYASEAL